jgi:hypothetical protein
MFQTNQVLAFAFMDWSSFARIPYMLTSGSAVPNAGKQQDYSAPSSEQNQEW